MRKVEYCKRGYYINSTGNNVASDFATGFFHGFFSEGNNDGGIECFAVVEKLDGTVHTMSTARVKFLTPPNEEQGESPVNNTQQTIPGSAIAPAKIAEVLDYIFDTQKSETSARHILTHVAGTLQQLLVS